MFKIDLFRKRAASADEACWSYSDPFISKAITLMWVSAFFIRLLWKKMKSNEFSRKKNEMRVENVLLLLYRRANIEV